MTPKSVWRCLNVENCDDARLHRTFRGPTQQEVRQSDTLLPCPTCESRRIIFVRDIEYQVA